MYIRSIFNQTLSRLQEPRQWIQVLLGPRQVGKTTGALFIQEQFEKNLNASTLFVAADEPTLRDQAWLEQQWNSARLKCQKSTHPVLLIIDEIQKIEGWSETVKRLWDEDSRNRLRLKVLLLGSATLLIQKGLTESLAGRFEINHVPHWLYPEMKSAFGFSAEDWIYFGGYPGPASLKNDSVRWAAFIRDALIETTVSRDILLIQRIEKPALLRRLFQLACAQSGQILSFQKMLGQLHDVGNATTLAHYLDLLSQAGLVCGLSKFAGNIVRQKASSPKLQVYNPALMSALGAISPDVLRANPELWGRQVESAIGAHLLNSIQGTALQLQYWNQGDKEVDFVLQRGEQILGIEVKSGARKKSVPGIKVFLQHYPTARAIVVGDSHGISIEEFLMTTAEELCIHYGNS